MRRFVLRRMAPVVMVIGCTLVVSQIVTMKVSPVLLAIGLVLMLGGYAAWFEALGRDPLGFDGWLDPERRPRR